MVDELMSRSYLTLFTFHYNIHLGLNRNDPRRGVEGGGGRHQQNFLEILNKTRFFRGSIWNSEPDSCTPIHQLVQGAFNVQGVQSVPSVPSVQSVHKLLRNQTLLQALQYAGSSSHRG